MEKTGGIDLAFWIKGSEVMKNYVYQLEYNRKKFQGD